MPNPGSPPDREGTPSKKIGTRKIASAVAMPPAPAASGHGGGRRASREGAITVAAMLTLRALTGELRGREFTFRAPARCMLGRSHNCQLRLPRDPTVSRQHCLVELDGAGAWVQDLCSLNGTHLNGAMIGQRQDEGQDDVTMVAPSRQALQDGDELQVCDNLFAVVLPSPPSRAAHGLTPGPRAATAPPPRAQAPGRREDVWCPFSFLAEKQPFSTGPFAVVRLPRLGPPRSFAPGQFVSTSAGGCGNDLCPPNCVRANALRKFVSPPPDTPPEQGGTNRPGRRPGAVSAGVPSLGYFCLLPTTG
jgi:hypothetical protein